MQIRSDNICILGHPNPSCHHAPQISAHHRAQHQLGLKFWGGSIWNNSCWSMSQLPTRSWYCQFRTANPVEVFKSCKVKGVLILQQRDGELVTALIRTIYFAEIIKDGHRTILQWTGSPWALICWIEAEVPHSHWFHIQWDKVHWLVLKIICWVFWRVEIHWSTYGWLHVDPILWLMQAVPFITIISLSFWFLILSWHQSIWSQPPPWIRPALENHFDEGNCNLPIGIIIMNCLDRVGRKKVHYSNCLLHGIKPWIGDLTRFEKRRKMDDLSPAQPCPRAFLALTSRNTRF